MTTAQQGVQDLAVPHRSGLDEQRPLLGAAAYDADEESLGQGSPFATPYSARNVETPHTPYDGDGVDRRRRDKAAFVVAVIGLITLVATTWIIIFTHKPSSLSWFAYHPTLQTLAISLFALGIMTLQPTSKADPVGKQRGFIRHQTFMFMLGFPLILLGSSSIFYNKASHGAPHFTTWHSTFGLISTIWIVAQVLIGAGSAWFGGKAFGGGDKAKAVYKYHRVSGYLLLACLLLTAHLGGAWSDWMVMSTNYSERVLAYTVVPIVVLAAVYSRARISKMPIFLSK